MTRWVWAAVPERAQGAGVTVGGKECQPGFQGGMTAGDHKDQAMSRQAEC